MVGDREGSLGDREGRGWWEIERGRGRHGRHVYGVAHTN